MSEDKNAGPLPATGGVRAEGNATPSISGAELLEKVVAALRKYVFLSAEQADAIALWVLTTWVIETAMFAPRLAITSVVKGCGKTTLLDVLSLMCRNARLSANITTASAARLIAAQEEPPTLLIDEADTFLSERRELIGLLNAGHRRGGTHIKSVNSGSSNWSVAEFPVFCSAAIACIGKLSPTLEDRSLKITMRRATKDETPSRLRSAERAELTMLGARCKDWAEKARPELQLADSAFLPDFLSNRSADNWEPLFSIAVYIGGGWVERTEKSARALQTAGLDDTQSDGELLLSDIRRLFIERQADVISSKLLRDELNKQEESPWRSMDRGQGIDQLKLAKMLKPHGIRPKNIRVGPATPKGYTLKQFEDAFRRYLPPIEPPRDATDD